MARIETGMATNKPPLPSESEALAKFVHDENILHYRKCLAVSTDGTQRKILLELLADELAK
jgi:hypothetical protein